MKTIETKLYCYRELSQTAKDRVIEHERNAIQNSPDDFTVSECMDSLKAIAGALGLRLTDWNIGPYNRNNFCRVNSDAQGNKAIARFVKRLIAHGYERKTTFKAMLEPGTGSFSGICGFTGVGYDEDICEAILEALLDGETMTKAFDRAAGRIMEMSEKEIEYRQTKEAILETLDQDAEVYTEDGSEF
jgi:hypothetical protein